MENGCCVLAQVMWAGLVILGPGSHIPQVELAAEWVLMGALPTDLPSCWPGLGVAWTVFSLKLLPRGASVVVLTGRGQALRARVSPHALSPRLSKAPAEVRGHILITSDPHRCYCLGWSPGWLGRGLSFLRWDPPLPIGSSQSSRPPPLTPR